MFLFVVENFNLFELVILPSILKTYVLPLINKSCLEFIWNSKIKDAESVIPIINNQIHPLCGLYHKSILQKLNSALEIKEFSLKKFLKSINTQYINMNNHKKKFINMNTKKDFEKIKTIYTNSEN